MLWNAFEISRSGGTRLWQKLFRCLKAYHWYSLVPFIRPFGPILTFVRMSQRWLFQHFIEDTARSVRSPNCRKIMNSNFNKRVLKYFLLLLSIYLLTSCINSLKCSHNLIALQPFGVDVAFNFHIFVIASSSQCKRALLWPSSILPIQYAAKTQFKNEMEWNKVAFIFTILSFYLP